MFRFFHRHWTKRWERFYSKNRWHLILDCSLGLLIIILAVAVLLLHFYRPNLPSFSVVKHSEINLNNPPLELDFSSATSSIKLAAGAPLVISFKNNGSEDLQNIKVSLQSSNQDFVLTSISGIDSDLAVIGNNHQVLIKKIPAGTSGQFTLQAHFSAKNQKTRQIIWQAESQYVLSGQSFTENFSLPTLNLAIRVTAQNLAYYTSPQGDQLGVGPVPPVVDIPTNYWVFWEIKADGDIKNLVFSGRLPQGVELTDTRSLLAGDFSYQEGSRQIIWKVSDIKANSDSYRLGFEVQLTPQGDQVGQTPLLISRVNYYGQDALTGEEISGSLGSLNTDLEFDRFNQGQGKVSAE